MWSGEDNPFNLCDTKIILRYLKNHIMKMITKDSSQRTVLSVVTIVRM